MNTSIPDITTIRLDRFGSIVHIPTEAARLKLPEGSIGYFRLNLGHSEHKGPVTALPVHNGPVVDGQTNGFFVEDLIAIANHRIGTLNGQFPCQENELAMKYLTLALSALDDRTERVGRERERQQQL